MLQEITSLQSNHEFHEILFHLDECSFQTDDDFQDLLSKSEDHTWCNLSHLCGYPFIIPEGLFTSKTNCICTRSSSKINIYKYLIKLDVRFRLIGTVDFTVISYTRGGTAADGSISAGI